MEDWKILLGGGDGKGGQGEVRGEVYDEGDLSFVLR